MSVIALLLGPGSRIHTLKKCLKLDIAFMGRAEGCSSLQPHKKLVLLIVQGFL